MSTLREEILASEETAWQELQAAIAAVPRQRWEDAAEDGWSIKDLLAHVACWQAECVRQLECIRSGRPAAWPEVEEFNREARERCSPLTVAEVQAMAGAARHRLREELDWVAPVALNSTLVKQIRECADRHYRDHLPWLHARSAGAPS